MVAYQKGRRGARRARLDPCFFLGGIDGSSSTTGRNGRGMYRFHATRQLFLEDDADEENKREGAGWKTKCRIMFNVYSRNGWNIQGVEIVL
jgi:hypothetical protein